MKCLPTCSKIQLIIKSIRFLIKYWAQVPLESSNEYIFPSLCLQELTLSQFLRASTSGNQWTLRSLQTNRSRLTNVDALKLKKGRLAHNSNLQRILLDLLHRYVYTYLSGRNEKKKVPFPFSDQSNSICYYLCRKSPGTSHAWDQSSCSPIDSRSASLPH